MIKKLSRMDLTLILSITVTFILNFLATPDKTINLTKVFAQSIGSVALVLFFWNFLIAARLQWLEKYFKPLDKQYVTHRRIAVSLILLIISHLLLNKLGVPAGTPEAPSGKYGSISMFIYILLVFTSMTTLKKIHSNKLGHYQSWKHFHKLFIIPYAIALYHYFINEEYLAFKFAPYQLWMVLINSLGIVLALYATIGYEKLRFKETLKITSIVSLNESTIEINMERPDALILEPGQFGFFKFYNQQIGYESHPFTLSSAYDGPLSITVKSLGDYTKKLITHLQISDLASFDGPYGNFNYQQGHKRQIWIAGGIGVTPFVSFVKSGIPSPYMIDFTYMHRADEDLYTDLFYKESQSNPRFTYLDHDSTLKGRLNLKSLLDNIATDDPVSIFYCGPDKPREMLEDLITNYKHIHLHYDRFKF